jgi:DNA-binding CsgD family transcriptional regulator
MVDFIHFVGLSTVGATVITDHGCGLTEFQSVTNAPEGYLADFQNIQLAKLDPVSQHCKHSSMPIVWDQDVYVESGRADFWEHQAAFGLRSGISVAFHLPRGRHFLFGVDCDRRTCGSALRARELAGDIQEFAAHAQAAAFDLCLPYDHSEDKTKLAKGEIDALRWNIDGLSNWEIGQAMSISETEVKLRLRRAMLKLGCNNKYEAALRAIRLGLVDCN